MPYDVDQRSVQGNIISDWTLYYTLEEIPEDPLKRDK